MKAQFEHQGRYTCQVYSSSGMTAAAATVQILGELPKNKIYKFV
jgi:hypothetical protein